jgi:hypothetical protein
MDTRLSTGRGIRVVLALLPIMCNINCADYVEPARPDAPASGVILIAGTDFSTGFLSAVDPALSKAYRDIMPIYNDSTLRYSSTDKATYVVERRGADAIRRLENAAGYLGAYQKSVGVGRNPQDAAMLPGNLMAVSLYNSNRIAVLNRSNATTVAEINLDAYADADGYAEIASLTYATGFLYVAVQRLNRYATNAIWPPVGDSYIIKVDTSNYSIIKSTLLSHSNPVSRLHHNTARNSLIVAAPARFASNYALDGACLEYSLASDSLSTPPITEVQAGYDIADCDIQADGSGVFTGYDAALNSVFGSFSTTTHALTNIAATLSSTVGGYYSTVLIHSNGKVYLADRNIYAPGLRVFGGPTLVEETTKAIYTGLPPYALEEVP